ncbi:MAG TPA: DHH family phosphoesterase, partial [Armatimonadota bacterium]|nr:DHH family phosphoesterase [Armatimonadota bacterium]
MKYRLIDRGPVPEEIIDRAGDKVLAAILWNRGIRTADEADALLNPSRYLPCSPAELPALEKAVFLIVSAIGQGRLMTVYGDYDADGVTSTALLVRTLTAAGARVSYHVPNRFTEGYGMNSEVVRRLAAEGCELIITCDCGISNHQEIALASSLGMTVIVTDHHSIPETMVPAEVVINPKYLPPDHACYSIAGVGVAYLLAQALQQRLSFQLDFEPLQLVALGTVSDVVPLTRENRYWVLRGLEIINSDRVLPGIAALIRAAKTDYVDEDTIGFQLGPRLNAPGRLA